MLISPLRIRICESTAQMTRSRPGLPSRLLRLCVKLWLLLPLLVSAQQATRPPVQSQVQPSTTTATFTSSTQLVIEKVSVKDKSGKVIEGLHKEDFTVTEDTKPQTIRFFDFEKIEDAASMLPPLPAPSTLLQLTQTQIAPE